MTQTNKAFKIYHVTDKVYLFLFDESFDLCMHFLRYQEFYESPKFNNRAFSIIEFMEWYAKTYGDGVFTYTKDWAGFNIPSNIIWKVHSNGIVDFNKYDSAMIVAYNQISAITHLHGGSRNDSFYILGACKDDVKVVGHELAHALYFSNNNYHTDMQACIAKLPNVVALEIAKYFTKIGYSHSVFEDELQAYMATGSPEELKSIKKYCAPFEKIFKSYTSKIKFDLKTAQPLNLS